MRSGLRVDDEAWAEFLRQVGVGISIGNAARQCGFSRSAVYYRRDRDEQFAAALRDAMEDSIDMLDTRAYELALAGDTDLLKFILRTRRRHIYGDKVTLNGDVRPRVSDMELATWIVSILASTGTALPPECRVPEIAA